LPAGVNKNFRKIGHRAASVCPYSALLIGV
jgi:hypothetical protein